MVYGESFENEPWANRPTWPVQVLAPGANARVALDGDGFHGRVSLGIDYTSGSGLCGLANRGLGNEGFALQGSKSYEGYVWVENVRPRSSPHPSPSFFPFSNQRFLFAKGDSPSTVVVELQDYASGKTLASESLAFAGGNWTQLNFTLTPSTSTGCTVIAEGSDPLVDCGKPGPEPGHVCTKCNGQIVVGLASPGSVSIDYVFLQPGAWGRLAGQPVRADTISTLKQIGVTAIRVGGSFTDPAYYFWKNWRGKPWNRPSMAASWGQEIIGGWGYVLAVLRAVL